MFSKFDKLPKKENVSWKLKKNSRENVFFVLLVCFLMGQCNLEVPEDASTIANSADLSAFNARKMVLKTRN